MAEGTREDPLRTWEDAEARTREFQGLSVGFYMYEYRGHVIWGATAGMLVNLHKMLE